MQKVYLLLRNNQQTGPHSFEELLELHLKPYDLIWVEGKSLGWRYPTEIETLKPFFAPIEPAQNREPASKPIESIQHSVNVTSSKKIFVSMPATSNQRALPKEPVMDPIEQKAEELRKRVEAFTPQPNRVRTNLARDLTEAEEEYTQWIYQTKSNKRNTVNKTTLAVVAFCVLLIAGGWWAGSKFLNSSSPIVKAVPQETIEKYTEPAAVEETVKAKNIVLPKIETATPTTSNPPVAKKIIKKDNAESKPVARQGTILPETVRTNNETTESPDTVSEETQKEEIIQNVPVAKKKTLKEKINDLLKKRKGGEETASTESKPTDSNNGERTATRRDDKTGETPILTDVSEQVEIKTNKIADSWMMGVKNLKLTLVNRSNLTITAAKIEVIYLSEQNTVLEKKILSYANISPNKSQTVSAPDQRLADHIEYKVISATGIENAYANN